VLIDTHTHIHATEFDSDRDLALARARSAGIEVCVAVGTDVEDSRRAVELAAKHSDVVASVGVHPHEAKTIDDVAYETLDRLAHAPRVVAYGEIGLDYYYEHSPRDVQREHFTGQVAIAARHQLPLIIHTRDAWEDTFALLEAQPHVGGVFHCFTGDLIHAQRAIENGFFISFSGIVTFAKSHELQEVVRRIDLNRVLIETDCPFLAPVPYRGRRNEPAYVVEVAKKIADLRSISVKEVAQRTTENARRCFPQIGSPGSISAF